MLRTIYTFKEGQAGLVDQAVRQERIALGKDRLAHQRRALADHKQANTVFAALQRNLANAADYPLRFAVKTGAECLGYDCVRFFQDDQDFARLTMLARPG